MTTAAPTEDRKIHTCSNMTLDVPDNLQIVEDQDIAAFEGKPDYGMFRCLSSKHGDKRVVWNRRSLPEIAAAKKMFSDLISQGMTPYRVAPGGTASPTVMDEFDPMAQEVIFMPLQMVGGG